MDERQSGNVVKMRLPPGFRFHPTDEELVVQYLKPKVQAYPFPASIIPQLDHVCNYDPWDLTGDSEDMYFFCRREREWGNTASGYWKPTGSDKQILSSQLLVGIKQTLLFYTGKGFRTHWTMHEYSLAFTPGILSPDSNWVLCKIFAKRRNKKRKKSGDEVEVVQSKRVFFEERRSADMTSSCSSVITDISELNESSEEGSTGSSNCNMLTSILTP